MYEYITGTLAEKSPVHAVVEAAGIGYFIRIPASTYRELPAVGSRCRLRLSLVVREDALDLYGFATAEEKRIFTELLRINGVGPQSALAVLSALEVGGFMRALEAADDAAIARARGIGRKLARRIVLELRGMLPPAEEEAPLPPAASEVEAALLNLGYTRREARQRLRAALTSSPGASAEELLRAALKSGAGK